MNERSTNAIETFALAGTRIKNRISDAADCRFFNCNRAHLSKM